MSIQIITNYANAITSACGLDADSDEIGHVSAPFRPPQQRGIGSGAGMTIV